MKRTYIMPQTENIKIANFVSICAGSDLTPAEEHENPSFAPSRKLYV